MKAPQQSPTLEKRVELFKFILCGAYLTTKYMYHVPAYSPKEGTPSCPMGRHMERERAPCPRGTLWHFLLGQGTPKLYEGRSLQRLGEWSPAPPLWGRASERLPTEFSATFKGSTWPGSVIHFRIIQCDVMCLTCSTCYSMSLDSSVNKFAHIVYLEPKALLKNTYIERRTEKKNPILRQFVSRWIVCSFWQLQKH